MTVPDPPEPKQRRQSSGGQKPLPKFLSMSPANDAGEVVFSGVFQPAELERWASFPCWNPFEAACVTCGFDPRLLRSAARPDLEARPDTFSEIEYRESLFQRSIRMQMVDEDIAPLEALQILEDRSCWYPPKLRETAGRFAQLLCCMPPANTDAARHSEANDNLAPVVESGGRFTSKSGRTKVIKLYQRMLLALSLDHLDLVPERPQNPTAKLILQAMAHHFKDLPNEDTVRDHIGFWINDQLER